MQKKFKIFFLIMFFFIFKEYFIKAKTICLNLLYCLCKSEKPVLRHDPVCNIAAIKSAILKL
jgi:hypothetical protein